MITPQESSKKYFNNIWERPRYSVHSKQYTTKERYGRISYPFWKDQKNLFSVTGILQK